MKDRIGNYYMSTDRSTVYCNNVAIFKSEYKRLAGFYLVEGQICFDDRKTSSIYRVIDYNVELVYYNVHFFSIQNLHFYYGKALDGTTVFHRVEDEAVFTKMLVSSNDYTDYFLENP